MVNLVKQNFLKNKQLYQNAKEHLEQKFEGKVIINHVGSTAIPNMYGKNIIDILVGAKDKNEFEKLTKLIVRAGYFLGKNKEEDYQFFASKEGETKEGDIHIHLGIIGTQRYNEFLVLKQYLLNNKSEVKDYSSYKKKLIKNGITDRKQYRAGKSEYVTSLLERAKKSLL